EERHRLRAPADVVGRVLRLGRDFGVGRSAGQAEVLRVVDVFRSGIDVVRMTWIGRPIPGRVEEPDAGLARRLDDRADTVDVGARGGTATGEVVADVGDVVVRPKVSGEAVGDRTETSGVRGCGSGRGPIAALGALEVLADEAGERMTSEDTREERVRVHEVREPQVGGRREALAVAVEDRKRVVWGKCEEVSGGR